LAPTPGAAAAYRAAADLDTAFRAIRSAVAAQVVARRALVMARRALVVARRALAAPAAGLLVRRRGQLRATRRPQNQPLLVAERSA